jgi:hypothetical protein
LDGVIDNSDGDGGFVTLINQQWFDEAKSGELVIFCFSLILLILFRISGLHVQI